MDIPKKIKEKRCSAKNLKNCSKAEIKSNVVSYTAYVIIFSALVTSFALVFSTSILDFVKSLVGDVSIWINLIITSILLFIAILILLKVQRKKKFWVDTAKEKKIDF